MGKGGGGFGDLVMDSSLITCRQTRSKLLDGISHDTDGRSATGRDYAHYLQSHLGSRQTSKSATLVGGRLSSKFRLQVFVYHFKSVGGWNDSPAMRQLYLTIKRLVFLVFFFFFPTHRLTASWKSGRTSRGDLIPALLSA